MFKIPIFLVAFVLLFSLNLTAQTTPNIGIGAEVGLPSGNFTNISGIGVGASIKADFPIASEFAITLNVCYMNFFGKKNQFINTQDLTYIPLKAGLKYQISEGFYAEGQLGAALPLNDGQKTVFVWSPGFGNQFRLSGNNKLDLGIRYEAWSSKNDTNIIALNTSNTKGFVGLRVAYVFGL
ncbi:hypothetical protein EZ449_06350 [Pedobacter frigidisoli]|uniref:Uncharacterized protein n=1 Tax=Pedobacter frigidisoli TaxID=2530455 RepID=A0A4R0P5H0_9SPHI|nr:outer membrane beta-barrel protein [Pedobacter frigidisoli]TCD11111.1 hypothetical protein EZ449_06350 [Pedobacter frigidisoli]